MNEIYVSRILEQINALTNDLKELANEEVEIIDSDLKMIRNIRIVAGELSEMTLILIRKHHNSQHN